MCHADSVIFLFVEWRLCPPPPSHFTLYLCSFFSALSPLYTDVTDSRAFIGHLLFYLTTVYQLPGKSGIVRRVRNSRMTANSGWEGCERKWPWFIWEGARRICYCVHILRRHLFTLSCICICRANVQVRIHTAGPPNVLRRQVLKNPNFIAVNVFRNIGNAVVATAWHVVI